MSRRAFLIVLDGFGIGATADQAAYGDQGSNTLGNTLARAPDGFALPRLQALGLGNCAPLAAVPPAARPQAAFGTALPAGAGKDSTTGHWELTGIILDEPFPTFPEGFPEPLLDRLAEATGRPVIGNRAGSGTTILEDFGPRHLETGAWIVYTSADSVFQIAAHEEVVPPAELYRACEVARQLCDGEWGVARVIARPFVGGPGAWVRTAGRRDFSLEPGNLTLLDRLERADIPRLGIGKVDDLFAGRGIQSTHTPTNEDAYRLLEAAMATFERGLVFANVIEFDQTWGHRNDVPGFLRGLAALDAALPRLLDGVRPGDLVILTADHGNDPTTPSTDHSRERVPVLVTGPGVTPADLGQRSTLADVGQTVADHLGIGQLAAGRSFLSELFR